MLIAAKKIPLIRGLLRAEYPDDIEGMLGKSIKVFYRNLSYALLGPDEPIHVVIPTGQLNNEELILLEHMITTAGWSIEERDRDYYKVTPRSGEVTEEQLIMKGELCPYCKVPTQFTGTGYECPSCMASVECHPGTTAAMGFVANGTLRNLRSLVHDTMDVLWMHNKLPRSEVYRRLREEMGLTKAQCHIAKFDEKQCKQALKCVNRLKKELDNERDSSTESGGNDSKEGGRRGSRTTAHGATSPGADTTGSTSSNGTTGTKP